MTSATIERWPRGGEPWWQRSDPSPGHGPSLALWLRPTQANREGLSGRNAAGSASAL